MKIIDAVWEKRNIGVETKEIILENEDTVEAVRSTLEIEHSPYVVVKCPSERMDLRYLMTQLGFSFVECSIKITHNLKDIALTGVQKRLIDSVSYAPMKDGDIEQLYDEIRGEMFTTDRVSMDPFFTHEKSANRYICWLDDEVKRGAELFKLVYKGDTVGFFVIKETQPGIYYPFLTGMYKKYRNTGLGFVYISKPIEEIVKRNGKGISSFISTNNSSALRMHAATGFRFEDVNYVFVKHNNA
ncbi:MAG: GNAT family N-acetyltransferase [Ruminococcaceae bacterium]|nr:GNAT family N-acetyltransferase [Oscillospiraceae bacterium]